MRGRDDRTLLVGVLSLVLTAWGTFPAPAGAQGGGNDGAAPRPPSAQAGQDVEAPRPPSAQAADPVAYLVTVGPGDALWERFGHSLLWIHDPADRSDEAYNYGLFSFGQEHFLRRFVMGHMDYWMAGFDVRRQIEAYRAQNRTVELQELALAPDQVRQVKAFLEWNARPENRTYRYHYYRDNCSTRVRDALDRVLGGQMGRWARSLKTDASYRDHTLRLTYDLFWASVGMDFGLGPSADVDLTPWEAMFIPMEMAKALRGFTFVDDRGEERPLVRSERMLYEADRAPVPARTPRRLGLLALAGALVAACFAWLGRRRGRAGFLALGIAWLVLVGLLGSLIAFLWAFTGHTDAAWNANLLQASPLHVALALLLVPLARGRAWARAAGRWTAIGVAGAAGLGLVACVATAIVPVVHQGNAPWVAFLLPGNLAVAWVVWGMTLPDPARAEDELPRRREAGR